MTVQAPKIPQGYQSFPIPPDHFTKAQTTVPNMGQRINTTLAILAALFTLYTLLGLVGIFWLGQNLNSLLEQLFILFKEPVPDLPPFPTWATVTLLFLTLLGGMIPIWGIWITRRTILAITQQTTEPNTESTEELMYATKTIQPWLLLGKWTPILSAILSFIIIVTLFLFIYTTYDLPKIQENILLELGPTLLLQIPSTFIQMIPTIIINWLIFNAIQNWLHAVATRSQTPNFPIQPFARSIDGWFLFVLILLGLNILFQAFSGLFLAFFPMIIQSIAPTPEKDKEIVELIFQSFSYLSIPMLFGIFNTIIYFLLILWSRQYAVGVGHILDSSLNDKAAPYTQPTEW